MNDRYLKLAPPGGQSEAEIRGVVDTLARRASDSSNSDEDCVTSWRPGVAAA
jgi:hypothetical protein